jgi:predicted TIM-barrel fold metal-dependent hydrolase
MKLYKKNLNRLVIRKSQQYLVKDIFTLAAILIGILPLMVSAQTKNSSQNKTNSANTSQVNAPVADYHSHIWSLNASTLVTDPLLPAINLPEELNRLLRDKEKFGGKDKNPTALTDLYTKDALILDPTRPAWLVGDRAVKYAADSFIIFHLIPTKYEVGDTTGFIAGYEAESEGTTAEYLSNFLYVIRKEADGKWRIASEAITVKGPPMPKSATPEQLIKELDAAGIKRAMILSTAYWFGNPRRNVQDEYAKVRAENDWVAQQIARYPDRLVGFFSFNPLKDYALEEINRCAKIAAFKGIKLHMGNSMVDMLNPEHVEKLRAVFRAANEKRLPIIIHLWTSFGNYGRAQAEVFLNQILPVAPDIPIQIAHMGASGPNYHSDDAFEVYATAAEKKDPRMKNVYTDVASMMTQNTSADVIELVAKRLRQFGLSHVLFGSDYAPGGTNETPKIAWQSFQRLPFTNGEFKTVAGNVAPYLQR